MHYDVSHLSMNFAMCWEIEHRERKMCKLNFECT